MTEIPFFKMHGLGNDYVYIDGTKNAHATTDLSVLSRKIADRHFGVGGDGLVVVLPGDHNGVRMRMFNADGSEAEMCGNAVRCVARFAYDSGIVQDRTFTVQIMGKSVPVALQPSGMVQADMGEPLETNTGAPMAGPDRVPERRLQVGDDELSYTPVSMGNPHAVIFVAGFDFDLHTLGRLIETHQDFPDRTNVEFVRVDGRSRLHMRVWERGSGETLACGSGACATLVAAVARGHTDRSVTVSLTGGELQVHWQQATNRISMTGPATYVFRGVYYSEEQER